MIEIKDKQNCCGCMACLNICPTQCIYIKTDEEGFDYPYVDANSCIKCGLCNKVCPILNVKNAKKPIKVYAAKNHNEEVRLKSSSGGIFTALAENTINYGGVVFGVSFDKDWNAVHTYTECIDKLEAFRGSKYVQSEMKTSYNDVKSFLNEGRQVLFSGTPCQIAALKNFLKKDYFNLLTVEILCHGVPSPKVWQRYLNEKSKEYKNKHINNIYFRNKIEGWSKYHFVIDFNNSTKYDTLSFVDPYFKGFISNLYLRPSCYECKCKNGRASSDITIADYWNIDEVLPEYNDDKGVSLILVNTEKGNTILKLLSSSVDIIETSFYDCIKRNDGFSEHIPIHKRRREFFILLNKNKYSLSKIIDKCFRVRLLDKLIYKAKKIFRN